MSPDPRRLHPAGILLSALGALQEAALPLLIAFVTGIGVGERSGGSALTLAGIGAVAALGIGYWRWKSTTWWVTEGAIHLRSGIFSADEKVIPKSRVQGIDTTQGPVQRMFGVLELHVQTAGGGTSAEITLSAVTPAEAVALRDAVGLPEPAQRDVEVLTLSTGALLITALTAPQLGVLLPILAGFAAVGDDLLAEGLRRGVAEQLPGPAAVAVAVLAAAALAWLLSILGSIVAFGGFTVERDGEWLRIRRGIGRRRAASVPVSRVHAVRVVEGVPRQPFGLATLRLEVAGYRSEAAAAQTLFPLVRRADADAILRRFLPELAGALGDVASPPRRALRRYVVPGALAAAVVGAAVVFVLPGAWPAAAALVVLSLIHGALRFRAAGWRLTEGLVAVRSRVIARQTLIAPVARLQEHTVAQSPLQRRARLADVGLAVASGRRAAVAHLDQGTARQLFDELRV